MHPNRDRRGLAALRERADGNPVCLLERLHEHSSRAIVPSAEIVRVLAPDRSRAPGRTSRSRAPSRTPSSAFSSSGSKRTYSSLDVSSPRTVYSRGTGPWIGHSRRIWIHTARELLTLVRDFSRDSNVRDALCVSSRTGDRYLSRPRWAMPENLETAGVIMELHEKAARAEAEETVVQMLHEGFGCAARRSRIERLRC